MSDEFDFLSPLSAEPHFEKILDDALASGNAGYVVSALTYVAREKAISDIVETEKLSEHEPLRRLNEGPQLRLDELLDLVSRLGFRLQVRSVSNRN